MTWLADFAAQISATASSKGFEAPSWDNYIAKLGLIHTELDEAVAAMSDERTPLEDIAAELADVGIRALDVLYTLGRETWSPARIEQAAHFRGDTGGHGRVFTAPEVLVQPIRRYVTASIEHRRREERLDAITALELAVVEDFRVARRCGIPLGAAMARKAEFNKSRPFLNGKKHASG